MVLDPVSKERLLDFTESYEFDTLGRKTSITNAQGGITLLSLDNLGNVLTRKVMKDSTSPEQLIETSEYDLAGNKIKVTDGNGNITLYEYNNFGKERKITTDGDSTIDVNVIVFQYDKEGQLLLQKDSSDGQDEFVYDNQGKLMSKVRKNQDGSNELTHLYCYDLNGNLRFETDENGVTKELRYSEMNLLTSSRMTVSGITQVTEYGYDFNGNQTSVKDWRGNITTITPDPLNRVVQKTNPSGIVVQKLEYNNNNAQVKSYDALNKITQFVYDRNGRLIFTIDPELHEISSTYDNAGNVATKADGKNNTTHYVYNEFNQLISVTNAKSETTAFTYDLAGNQLTQTDGKGNITSFEYNARNKMKKRIDAGGRTGSEGNYVYVSSKEEHYTYNADLSLATSTDRNGALTEFTYDVHDRLLLKKIGTTEVHSTYDGNGNLLTVTDSTGTTTRTYDELNRVLTKQVPNIGTVTYGYDITAGMPTGYVGETALDPKGNSTTKAFDKELRLKEVRVGSDVTTYTYNANGSKTKVVYPDGANENYTYNNDGLLTSLINKGVDETTIDSYAYTFDEAHNQTSKVDAKGTTDYAFDALNRLLVVTEPTGRETTYSYDEAGNRLTSSETLDGNTVISTYSYNGQNRLVSVEKKSNDVLTSNEEMTYDSNGNLTESETVPYVEGVAQTAVLTSMDYDKFNQLISVDVEGVVTSYGYNGEGQRITKTAGAATTHSLYEGDKVVLEVDQAGAQIAHNVYGNNLLSRNVSATTLYYMYNGHGDVTALIDATGTKQASYYYDAFGNVMEQTGTVNNNILYAGYQYDKETGLYYLNSRMYDPVTARFMQEDTYRGKANDPLSLNLYTYCHNEPLMYSDPTGHWRALDNPGDKKVAPGQTKTSTMKTNTGITTSTTSTSKAGVATTKVTTKTKYGITTTTKKTANSGKAVSLKTKTKMSVGVESSIVKEAIGMNQLHIVMTILLEMHL